MIIYLARHGQTTGDIEGRYGGDYDDKLTDEGQQQAQILAEQLNGKGIEKLFSSPRIRAKETAKTVGEKLKLDPIILDDFRERNRYGILTGLLKSDAKLKYPAQVEEVKVLHTTIEGAEDYELYKARIKNALNTLANKNTKVCAVITHGGIFKFIFEEILKSGRVEVADCAYVALDVENEGYRLVESHGVINS